MTMIETGTMANSNGAHPPASAALAPAQSATSDGPGGAISAFASEHNFIAAQRMAKALSSSSLVPAAYQNNIPNVLIAMEMAARIGVSVFMVMQSLDIIHGRPSWRAQFLIGTVNASGRFTPIRFRWQGTPGKDDWGCRAVAKDRESGEECVGPLVTIQLSKDEGWYAKPGSKWKTIPELMLMYRAGGFWTRVYCPEMSLGMHTTEEAIDTTGYAIPDVVVPKTVVPGSAQELEAALLGAPTAKPSDPGTTEPATASSAEVAADGSTVESPAQASPVDEVRKAKSRRGGEPENGAAS